MLYSDVMQEPDDFVAALSRWQLPPQALANQSKGHENAVLVQKYAENPITQLPDLLGTLGTLRKRFYALNYAPPAAQPSSRLHSPAKTSGAKKR
jgi:hypothetical protein